MNNLHAIILSLVAFYSINYVVSEERIETLEFTVSHCTGNGDCGMDALGTVSAKVKL